MHQFLQPISHFGFRFRLYHDEVPKHPISLPLWASCHKFPSSLVFAAMMGGGPENVTDATMPPCAACLCRCALPADGALVHCLSLLLSPAATAVLCRRCHCLVLSSPPAAANSICRCPPPPVRYRRRRMPPSAPSAAVCPTLQLQSASVRYRLHFSGRLLRCAAAAHRCCLCLVPLLSSIVAAVCCAPLPLLLPTAAAVKSTIHHHVPLPLPSAAATTTAACCRCCPPSTVTAAVTTLRPPATIMHSCCPRPPIAVCGLPLP